MFTSVISLILVAVAFFIISTIIFRNSYDLKNMAEVFIPVKKINSESLEADVRTIMSDVNMNYKKTIKRVYLVNIDGSLEVDEICYNLCSEYSMLEICSLNDVSKIISK